MRHRAWLDATPKGQKQPRAVTYQGGYPEVDCCAELIEYLWAVGPITASAMGLQPVTWQELQAWREMSATDCEPWELEQVKMLSMVYLDQYNKAEKPECPAPWIDPDFVDHVALGDRIKKQFRAFKRARGKK